MSRKLFSILALVACATFTSAAIQKRVKAKGAEDFPAIMAAANQSWNKQEYKACIKSLNKAVELAVGKHTEVIRAALPKAPTGWEVVADRNNQAANPFAAMMSGAVGTIINQKYRQTDGGRSRLEVTVTVDSPLVQMFGMWLNNPAMLPPESELIEYGTQKAVLKKEGNGWNLQILIHGAHICEVRATGMDEDALFKVFDQAAVDKLAEVLRG